MKWVTGANDIVWTLAFLVELYFVVTYFIRTGGAWRKTAMGRQIMAKALIIVIVLGLSLARRFFGDYFGREFLILLMGVGFTITLIVRNRLFSVEQHRQDERDELAEREGR